MAPSTSTDYVPGRWTWLSSTPCVPLTLFVNSRYKYSNLSLPRRTGHSLAHLLAFIHHILCIDTCLNHLSTYSSLQQLAPPSNIMLVLKPLAAILALGLSSATAAPAKDVAGDTANVARARRAQVYACKNADWNGTCRTFGSAAGQCCRSKSELGPL
jgi:hypothetical protein